MSACIVPGCPDPARVVVEDPTGDRAPACQVHWQDMLRCSHGLIRAIALVPLDSQADGGAAPAASGADPWSPGAA